MRKQYIEVPLAIECSPASNLWRKLIGIFLTPVYFLAAKSLNAPGIEIHLQCAILALRLLFLGRLSLRAAYDLIFCPIDSTRYFEFHEVMKSLKQVTFHRYLDVSSPRMVPLLLLMQNKTAFAEILNPDGQDLLEKEQLITALGLTQRCVLQKNTLEEAIHTTQAFDLITCVSVLEHIPADRRAVEIMWSLLCSGGRLILTLPCRAQPLEQYISRNDYGVLSPGSDGYTFWQRYYDVERLNSAVFDVTGKPTRAIVYGEKQSGLFFRNASMKRLIGGLYPFWRESYMMATEYLYFKSIADLPGEGVILLEFSKP